MTHCNHGEHGHSNWECFFKSTACRRRYMARSVISCNNGGGGGSGYAFGINPGRSSSSGDFSWMMKLLWEPEGGSAGPSWLQISCVTLAMPTDCSITQFLHLLNESEYHMLSIAHSIAAYVIKFQWTKHHPLYDLLNMYYLPGMY